MSTTRLRRLTILLSTAALLGAGTASAQTDDECNAASEKASTLRRSGKLLDARKELTTCAAASCPDVMKSSCTQRLDDVNRALPSIVFDIKDASGRDIPDARLAVDGAMQANASTAVALDPGDHEFRFEAAGQDPVVKHFVLRESEKDRREPIVIGGALIVAPPPPTAPTDRSGQAPPSTPPAETTATSGNSQRTLGLVVGGVGVAGLVVGGIFGALSMSAHGSYEKSCGSNIGAPPGECNSAGVSGQSDAATKGTISTVAFVVGGIGAAAGAFLFFTAPSAPSRAQVGVGPGTVWLRGQF